MSDFYDGTKLLSLVDLDGQRPELVLCTTNRSAGKTTWFSRYLVKRFLQNEEKFCLIYRYKYELADVAEKFFGEIGQLFFPGYEMAAKLRASGTFVELLLDGESCGYAVALNTCDMLKKYSHMLCDTKRMFFDEFQSETNHYCNNEMQKFISLHTSIARGGGKSVRFVPVFMASNAVSIINPYYVELGISERLEKDTRFLRGNGWVLETGYVESVAEQQQASAFNRAFSGNKYVAYSSQNVYLSDSTAFIEKPNGNNTYIATIKYQDKLYAIRQYAAQDILYCDDRIDHTCQNRISVTTDDHQKNYMLLHNDPFVGTMRVYFDMGFFRFKNLACKQAILRLLSY